MDQEIGALRAQAHLMRNITMYGAKTGTIELAHGRLSFRLDSGEPVFDVAVTEIEDATLPKMNAGAVIKLRIGGASHRISFVGSVRISPLEDVATRRELANMVEAVDGVRAGRALKRSLDRARHAAAAG